MKKIKFLLIVLLTMSFAMTSCQDDSVVEQNPDETETIAKLASQIIGTWRDSAYENGEYMEITFKKNGTFSLMYVDEEGFVESEEGKYIVSDEDNLVTLNYFENGKLYDSWTFEVKVVDKNRIIMDGLIFTRQ